MWLSVAQYGDVAWLGHGEGEKEAREKSRARRMLLAYVTLGQAATLFTNITVAHISRLITTMPTASHAPLAQ